MVKGGLELVLGAQVHPHFGPMVVIGLGGVMIELLRDTAMLPAPADCDAVEQALAGLRGASAFQGFRGLPPVDMARLCEIVARFSEFVADHSAIVREIDVNPLIWNHQGFTAVDALILTESAD
jgi:acetyl-CoA synthetase